MLPIVCSATQRYCKEMATLPFLVTPFLQYYIRGCYFKSDNSKLYKDVVPQQCQYFIQPVNIGLVHVILTFFPAVRTGLSCSSTTACCRFYCWSGAEVVQTKIIMHLHWAWLQHL